MVTFEQASLIIGARPDILPFYKAHGWDIGQGNWVNIVTNWWGMTTERDQWGGDINKFLASLRPTPIVTQAEAQAILSKRPDILALFAKEGWDTSSANYVYIVSNWWAWAPERSTYSTIQEYIQSLSGVPPSGDGIIPELPPIFGLDAKVLLVAGAAIIIGMLFFGD